MRCANNMQMLKPALCRKSIETTKVLVVFVLIQHSACEHAEYVFRGWACLNTSTTSIECSPQSLMPLTVLLSHT